MGKRKKYYPFRPNWMCLHCNKIYTDIISNRPNKFRWKQWVAAHEKHCKALSD